MRNLDSKAFLARAVALLFATAAPLVAQTPAPPANAVTTSAYITTRDGTRLAVDVHLPADRASGAKMPALLELTRYWRAGEDAQSGKRLNSLGALDRFFLKNGYAVLKVDARGSGASFGTRSVEYGPEETKDGWDVVEWVVHQPWSSGAVGAYGTSYSGTTAELLAASGHPAVKAVVPGWSDFDMYASPARPYGLATAFVGEWGRLVGAMDRNDASVMRAHVRRVDADSTGIVRDSAVASHAKNPDVGAWALAKEFRDDHDAGGPSWAQTAPIAFKKEIEQGNVPMLVLVSWLDAGTIEGTLDRLKAMRNPQKVVIMASSHGGGAKASPFSVSGTVLVNDPPPDSLAALRLRFFDRYLKNTPNGVDVWPRIRYFTLGSESWSTSEVWPLPGTAMRRMWIGDAHGLNQAPPSAANRDDYKVDFGVSTGEANRWATQMGRPILHLDERGPMDERMLTYTTEPLPADLRVAGAPVITLQVSSTHADGALLVYLEDIDERGQSRYVTEGGLRLIHRKTARDTTIGNAPFHSFNRGDAEPMKPGVPARITFRMLPTSVLFKKGHRLRLAIAGADSGVLQRVPAEGTPTLTIHRGDGAPSYLELPVVSPPKAPDEK